MSGEDERYDPVANPYAPGAGTPPPALVGRDAELDAIELGMRRLLARRSTQHLMITGLRGTGKTVLLNHTAGVGESLGFRPIRVEGVVGDDPIASLLRQARLIVEDWGTGSRITRALHAIEAVSLTIGAAAMRVERPDARPDREALADVISGLAAVAADHDAGVLLAIDEAQLVDRDDLKRILAGIHRANQDGLPVLAVLAGLPNLVRTVADAATYAERLFTVSVLGSLSVDHVVEAVTRPAAEIGVEWSAAAAEAIADRSDGFPFFVQTWAFHTWNVAVGEPISTDDVARAESNVRLALDTSFFASRIARIPASEVDYVRALASLGPGPHRSGEVAAALDKTTSQVSAIRDRVIDEGVAYSPRYGWIEFAIPHFDEFIRRELPNL